jgi:hypothetical protein
LLLLFLASPIMLLLDQISEILDTISPPTPHNQRKGCCAMKSRQFLADRDLLRSTPWERVPGLRSFV